MGNGAVYFVPAALVSGVNCASECVGGKWTSLSPGPKISKSHLQSHGRGVRWPLKGWAIVWLSPTAMPRLASARVAL